MQTNTMIHPAFKQNHKLHSLILGEEGGEDNRQIFHLSISLIKCGKTLLTMKEQMRLNKALNQ